MYCFKKLNTHVHIPYVPISSELTNIHMYIHMCITSISTLLFGPEYIFRQFSMPYSALFIVVGIIGIFLYKISRHRLRFYVFYTSVIMQLTFWTMRWAIKWVITIPRIYFIFQFNACMHCNKYLRLIFA